MITWLEFNRADNGTPYVTAYEGGEPIYTHKVTDTKDLFTWCGRVGASCNILVAETDKKVIPKVGDAGDWVAKAQWLPWATKHHKMPTKEERWPKKLVIHWTAGEPSQGGKSGIEEGASRGFTYLFLTRTGELWQGAPLNAGGYHAGAASVSSFDCLGVEVACAGRLEKKGNFYVPWFAKRDDGTINEARCIPKEEVIYDEDGPADDESFEGYYQSYTVAQMKSLTKLALYCIQQMGMAPGDIVGHDMIATPKGRKVDPGFSIGDGGMVAFRKRIAEMNAEGIRWESVGIVFPEEEENGIINDILCNTGTSGFTAKSQYVHSESYFEGTQGAEEFDSEPCHGE